MLVFKYFYFEYFKVVYKQKDLYIEYSPYSNKMVWGLNKGCLMGFIAVFVSGILVGMIGVIGLNLSQNAPEMPFSFSILAGKGAELSSPADHIPEKDIHVLSDKIVIDVKDASWASFTDTNSMDPFIDAGANSVEIKPESEEDIHVGDVISFRTEYADGIIIHRVVEIGNDSDGNYFITRGDNTPTTDPGKRRFADINGVVVGVIY